jgi:hypothetical protein
MLRNCLPLFVTLVAACVNPAGSARSDLAVAPVGTPTRVDFRDYRTGVHLVIVNDSHLAVGSTEGANPQERRAEFYSETRAEAKTKVASDEIMDALLDYFDDAGLPEGAAAGYAPAGSEHASQSIEVRAGEKVYHVLGRRDMPVKEARALRESVVAFNQIYNSLYQLQAVDATPGAQLFKTPARPKRRN